jgi:hypothetical protein
LLHNISEDSLVRHAILIAALLFTAGCAKQAVSSPPETGARPGTSSSNTNVVGAASSRAAVEGFLAAAKRADLQAMSSLWGNDRSLVRDRLTRDELEKRLVVIQCHLQHDRWSFADDAPLPQLRGRLAWTVSLTRMRVTAKATVATVQGPDGRWFVEDVPDLMTALKDFCAP